MSDFSYVPPEILPCMLFHFYYLIIKKSGNFVSHMNVALYIMLRLRQSRVILEIKISLVYKTVRYKKGSQRTSFILKTFLSLRSDAYVCKQNKAQTKLSKK